MRRGARDPCFTVLLHFVLWLDKSCSWCHCPGYDFRIYTANISFSLNLGLSSIPTNPFPLNTGDCLCNISGKIYLSRDIYILLFRKSLSR